MMRTSDGRCEFVVAYRESKSEPCIDRSHYFTDSAEEALTQFTIHHPSAHWHTVLKLVPVLTNTDE